MKRIYILSVLLLLPVQLQAFECIVKLNASSALVQSGDGSTHHLNHENSRITLDDCDGLQLKSGQARIYFANEEGYPDERNLLINEKVSSENTLNGGEGAPPFVFLFSQLKKMISGDRRTAIGAKRAFSSAGVEGMPSGEVLPPSSRWRFAPVAKNSKLKSMTIKDAETGSTVVTAMADQHGVFVVNGALIRAGHTYQWVSGNKHDEFNVLDKSAAQAIRNEISSMINKSSSKELMNFMTASVYSDHDLFFDARKVLNNE